MLDINKINKIADPKVRKQLKLDILDSIKRKKDTKLRTEFLPFVKHIWPDFIEGYHHKKIAKKFNRLATGKTKKTYC